MYSPHPDPNTLIHPPIQAFERLWVTDGLRMTAERWRSAHHYHRQRQNFHYQSLHQTGIVCGLGVTPMPAPNQVKADYRDGRWVQVQAGIAIDADGNPIIVTHPQPFRIKSAPPEGESWQVYLVAQYVDPDGLNHAADQERVQEQFRIVEKTTLDRLDVEICRIQLDAGQVTIQAADNVFAPAHNQLDFRHRAFVQPRSWGIVRMAQIKTGTNSDEKVHHQLTQLLEATDGLFPALRGCPQVDGISLDTITHTSDSAPFGEYELLYLPYQAIRQLRPSVLKHLKQYLDEGGTLMVVANLEAARLNKLKQTRQELIEALRQLDPALNTQEVKAEIAAYDTEINGITQMFDQTFNDLTKAMAYPMQSGRLGHDHPIRRYPFLFAALPQVDGYALTLFNRGGIVMVIGDLPGAWSLDEQLTQSRESIRAAQELGINLLHFAWRRRHLMQLQQISNSEFGIRNSEV
jgi:hypothetical protein